MADPTPGELAYTAWERALHAQGRLTTVGQWSLIGTDDRAAWEAAAQAVRADLLPTPERTAVTAAVVAGQAVLDHRMTDDISCPVCGAHDLASTPPGLTVDGDVHRDMTCEDCAATWVCVYTFREVAYVQKANSGG